MAEQERRCLQCGYTGIMKTWLANYNVPQLIGCILILFYVIPGLIFIVWGWGKFKCPRCGALAKDVQSSGGASIAAESQPKQDRIEQLERLARLRDQGAISVDEFESEKRKLLNS